MKKIVVISAAAVLAASMLSVVVPQASAAPTHEPNVPVTSSSTLSTQAAATTKYWTAARMASAKPIDKVAPKTNPTAAPAQSQGVSVGAPASVAPSLPKAALPTLVPKLTYTTGAVPRPYTNFPDRLNGKVFFTQGGLNYVCSGTVVNSTNKDMIDTAGHCVSDGVGHFHTNWAFVPAYSSSVRGQQPYGIWPARNLNTMTEWHVYSNLKEDLGYANLQTVSGRHIVNYLGGQGTAWNQFLPTIYEFGYPQAAPYNGFDQRLTVSRITAFDDPYQGRYGPLTIKINSTQTGGTSGGGWLISLSTTTGLGWVNSHSSYRYSNNASTLYGPYYGRDSLSLYNATRVR